ncbi:hypothetical protein Bbelb_018290 [Branchiostoma belcheri]|nr:hypothetical protein Bbelb_018290 [Branchiostoma belcheri]
MARPGDDDFDDFEDDCTEIESAEEADHEDDDPIEGESSCSAASAAASGGGTLACDICSKVYKSAGWLKKQSQGTPIVNMTTPGNSAARTASDVLGILGHRLQDFTNDVTCSICGVQGHVHRACPKSFANVVTPGGRWTSTAEKERQAELTQLKAKLAEKEKKMDDCRVNVMVAEREVARLRNVLALQPHFLKLPKLLPNERADPKRGPTIIGSGNFDQVHLNAFDVSDKSHFNPRRNGDTRVCDCGREIVRRDVDRLAKEDSDEQVSVHLLCTIAWSHRMCQGGGC